MQRMQDEIAEASGCIRSVEPGPWRGLEHHVVHAIRDWHSVVQAPDGAVYLAAFSGHLAEARAREYAALMSAPTETAAPSTCDACGKPASTGRCFRCTVALGNDPRQAIGLSATSVDGIEAWIGQPARDLAAAWNAHAGIVAKPAVVALCHRWSCVGVEGELEVCELRPAIAGFSGDVGLRPLGSAGPATVRARAADMLGLKEWRFLG
jgi:hypothetical protein